MSCNRAVKILNPLDLLSGKCLTKKNKYTLVNKKYEYQGCFTSNHSLGVASNRYFRDWDDARCNYLDGVQYTQKVFVKRINKSFYISYNEWYNPVIVHRVYKQVTPHTTYYYYVPVDSNGRLITKRLIAEVPVENYVPPIWEEIVQNTGSDILMPEELPAQVRCKIGFRINEFTVIPESNGVETLSVTYIGKPFMLTLNGISQDSSSYVINGNEITWTGLDLVTTDVIKVFTYYATS